MKKLSKFLTRSRPNAFPIIDYVDDTSTFAEEETNGLQKYKLTERLNQ